MHDEYGQIPGGAVADDLRLHGQIIGDAYVPNGVRLVLRGQVAGTLTIETGGSADIHGMVTGDLINYGTVSIAGSVIGALRDESGGARVEPGASIGRG